tara:strand:+ start:172 stop:585 length:414 start_codon:yes stop_codon:yes gene_type:complete
MKRFKRFRLMKKIPIESDIYDMVEHVVDDVFLTEKFTFNMYNYLVSNKLTGPMIDEFIDSSTAQGVRLVINELTLYIEGGNDSEHKQIREAYGYLGKPTARKIRTYLDSILSDVHKYKSDKRPGRRKGSKNRRKVTK